MQYVILIVTLLVGIAVGVVLTCIAMSKAASGMVIIDKQHPEEGIMYLHLKSEDELKKFKDGGFATFYVKVKT